MKRDRVAVGLALFLVCALTLAWLLLRDKSVQLPFVVVSDSINGVREVCANAQGSIYSVWSDSEGLEVRDAHGHQIIQTLPALPDRALSVFLTADGEAVIVPCQDCVWRFHLKTLNKTRVMIPDSRLVFAAFAQAAGLLAVVDDGRQVTLLRVDGTKSGTCVIPVPIVLGMCLSDDGKLLAVTSSVEDVTILSTDTWDVLKHIKLGSGTIRSLGFHPNGDQLYVLASHDRLTRPSLRLHTISPSTRSPHKTSVIGLDDCNATLLLGCTDGNVLVATSHQQLLSYSPTGGKILATWRLPLAVWGAPVSGAVVHGDTLIIGYTTGNKRRPLVAISGVRGP
jgi:WD40 repeat protein